MSLQVWLPLTKDLRQQGLSDMTVTNNGATFNSAGKLGGCYSFNDNYIQTNYNFYPGTNDFSVSCWFYLTENTNKTYQHICSFKTTAANSAGIAMIYNRSQQKFLWSTADGNSAQEIWSADTFPTSTIYNTWHHLVMVRDKNDAKHGYFYLNGVRKELASVPTILNITTNANTMKIGSCGQLYSTYYWTGKLNDFRLYDHALSQMEVKELAKGLVLHYPLSNIASEGTTNLITSITAGGQTSVSNGVITTSGTNADTYFTLNLSESITSGIQYTISCYAEIPSGASWNFPLGTQSNASLPFVIYNGYNEYTFIANDISWGTNRCFMDDGNGATNTARSLGVATKMWNFQLEKKDHATPFVGYGVTKAADTTEYDCSGFCNNGTRTGTFTWIGDTPKYTVSQYFEDYTRYISCPMGDSWIPDAITMSCWIKGTNHSARGGYHLPLNMHTTNFEISITGSSGKARMGFVVGGTRYVSDIGSDILNGDWHMLTLTYNGSQICRYIDGILVNSENRTGALTSASTLGVGQFPGATTYGNTQLYESDVRIYATALSADDVKSLYQNSAYIDSSGNIYGTIHEV